MTIFNARNLTQDDLEFMGITEQVESHREELLNRVYNRPPEGYVCDIHMEITSKVIRKAIDFVLKCISEEFYEDALCLEERIADILPLAGDSNWFGLWDGECVFLMDDKNMNFDLACVVFAHECGHVVNRGEYIDYIFEGVLHEDINEAAANYYVRRWGFGEQLKDAKDKGLGFITAEELDHLITP